MMRALVLSLAALAALLLHSPRALGAETSSEVSRLQAALAAHPDDPDLRHALGRALARAGRPAEAARCLSEVEQRWPERYLDLWLEIGRLRYEAGDDEGALRALARAQPSGAAHFWRGLALRRLGRTDEANRALEVAGRLAPGLRAEASLLRGLDRLAAGDSGSARALLEEAATHDRSGALASAARAVLPRDVPTPRFASLFASAGFEHDSNVTLDSGSSPVSSRESDARAVWGAGVLLRPLRREPWSVVIGYRFQSAIQDDLVAYDYDTHALSAGAGWRAHERLALRLDGSFASSVRDDDPYLRSVSGFPSASVTLGPRAGLLRLFGELTRRNYHDEPLLPSLERSGRTLGFGLTHFAPLPWREGAWSALSARRAVTRSDAERDLLGFAGDYDGVRFEGAGALHLPLSLGWAANGAVSLARERYFHRNLIDALTDEGVGTATPRRRRDTQFESRLALERPLSRWVTLEVAWRYAQALSNVDVYEYDRHVVGVHLRAEL